MLMPAIARRALSGVEWRVRKYFPPRPRVWHFDPRKAPWFDQPNALELLEQRRRVERLSDLDFELLLNWVNDGYCVAKGAISPELIDDMLSDLDDLWTAKQAFVGVEFCRLQFGSDEPRVTLSHGELLEIEESRRLSARDRPTGWRVHGFHSQSQNAAAIFNDAKLKRIASLILNRTAIPRGTINFQYGSEQTAHQDTAVFHVFPPNYIVGAWIACEDISPDCGPLMFYPKSHREALFSEFTNYPQTNLRTASPEISERYDDYVQELTSKYDRELFVAKKGDVLFWHGMVLHGGSEIRDNSLTRKSYVIHYIPDGMDMHHKVAGPFNW